MQIHGFLKCQKLFLYLFEMNSLQKHGYRGIRQKEMNFRCRSLVQFKVMWKLFFFCKCQKLCSCIFLKWIHSKNVSTETLDRNSWILDASHLFTSKSREYCLFFEISIAIPVPIWNEFTPKRGFRGITQKQLNFRCRSLVQIKVTWKLFFWNVKSYL